MRNLKSLPFGHVLAIAGTLGSLASLVACGTDPAAIDEPDPVVDASVPTDPDSGGKAKCASPPCADGAGCSVPADCVSNVCKDSVCFSRSAGDGIKNGTETDVDCGGDPNVAPRCDDGKACAKGADCKSLSCRGFVCFAPTGNDNVKNGTETDVDCGGAAPTNAKRCSEGKVCKEANDCADGVCNGGVCKAPTSTDGIKNGNETGIDCGKGPAGFDTKAPPCPPGTACTSGTDCGSGVCTGNVCVAATYTDGVKNGDESDIDCGGAAPPAGKKCATGKVCALHRDCASDGCDATMRCADARSCTNPNGGTTCGAGEVGAAGAMHESCCKSLPVAGYTDPRNPGKVVYLDKYEVTAGRVRTFVERIMQANGGVPNIKGWVDANPPAYWNAEWNMWMPTNFSTIVDIPRGGIDATKDFGTVGDVGLDRIFGYGGTYFYTHGDNCRVTSNGIYGYPTWWYPENVMVDKNLGGKRFFSQAQLDTQSMNCIPNAVLAAFCAWDGGQLATSAVLRFVANTGTSRRVVGARPTCETGEHGRMVALSTAAPQANFTCDAGQAPFAYFYPATGAGVTDGANRVAAPGRMTEDVVRINAGDEPWMDLRGNMHEMALADAPGAGLAFATGHFNGIGAASGANARGIYPEFKAGWMGGRCMRFKDP